MSVPIADPVTSTIKPPAIGTLRRAVSAWEKHGEAGLKRKERADKGTTRTAGPSRWSKAVPFDQETKARIWSAILDKIRGRLKLGASLGDILFSSERDLKKATRAEGFDPAPSLCAVPAHLVKKEKVYKIVDQFKRNKKRFQDGAPGIARFIGQTPMRIVVGDVHPSDIILHS